MEDLAGGVDEGDIFRSVSQVTRVTLPLMSVSQICDNGHTVHFDKQKGALRIRRVMLFVFSNASVDFILDALDSNLLLVGARRVGEAGP